MFKKLPSGRYEITLNLRYATYTMMLIAFALSCLIVAGVRPWH